MTKTATVGAKGQVVIPVEFRRELGLEPGQRVDVQLREGVLMLRPVPRDLIKRLRGSLRGGSMLQHLIREHAEEVRRDAERRV
jgi:AbrB family looped-hinge helix DNA binding protein